MSYAQPITIEADEASVGVVEAVARAEDVDSLSLPPLYEAIDPDALDKVIASTPSDGQNMCHVSFSYFGYEVTVTTDGQISVEQQDT